MLTTFSKVILLAILFSQVETYGQDGSMGIVSDTVTVDFRERSVSSTVLPGYSGEIVVDDQHKLKIICTRETFTTTEMIACGRNEDGSLILKSDTWLPFETRRAVIVFDPPATAVSGVITGSIGPFSVNTTNTVQLKVDSTTLLLVSNIPAIYNYPFSYTAPDGINLFQITGGFISTTGGYLGDTNYYYKVGLQSLTWSTNFDPKLDISVVKFDIVSSSATNNDKLVVSPSSKNIFLFDLKAEGRRSNENRVAVAKLWIGSNPTPLTHEIPLNSFDSSNQFKIKFESSLTYENVGPNQIKFEILHEEDIESRNNELQDFFYVGCNVEREVQYFSQADSRWDITKMKYAFTEKSMRAKGCYVTSLAMLMQFFGINKSYTGEDINPGTVNLGLIDYVNYVKIPQITKHIGYSKKSNDLEPMGAVNFARYSFLKNCLNGGMSEAACFDKAKSKISYLESERQDYGHVSKIIGDFKTINKYLCEGRPVIAKVKSLSGGHFLVVKGMDVLRNGEPVYKVNDPGDRTRSVVPVGEIIGVRPFKQVADPSMIYMSLTDGLHMVITEPDGKKIGFNSLQNIDYDENLKSRYFEPDVIANDDGSEITEDEYESKYENYNAKSGIYLVEVFNHKSAPVSYSLIKNSYDVDGWINQMNEYSAQVQPGQSIKYNLQHSDEPYVEPRHIMSISKALFIDTQRKDKALIFGNIKLENNSPFPMLTKQVKINISNLEKIVSISKFHKLTNDKDGTVYKYTNWNKNEVVFQLNTKTGDFLLSFDNINLSDEKQNLTTSLRLTLDNIIVQNIVTFKNIPVKNKKHQDDK